jgi:hypothetical protein
MSPLTANWTCGSPSRRRLPVPGVGLDRAQPPERPDPVDQAIADREAVGLRREAQRQLVDAELEVETVRTRLNP